MWVYPKTWNSRRSEGSGWLTSQIYPVSSKYPTHRALSIYFLINEQHVAFLFWPLLITSCSRASFFPHIHIPVRENLGTRLPYNLLSLFYFTTCHGMCVIHVFISFLISAVREVYNTGRNTGGCNIQQQSSWEMCPVWTVAACVWYEGYAIETSYPHY